LLLLTLVLVFVLFDVASGKDFSTFSTTVGSFDLRIVFFGILLLVSLIILISSLFSVVAGFTLSFLGVKISFEALSSLSIVVFLLGFSFILIIMN